MIEQSKNKTASFFGMTVSELSKEPEMKREALSLYATMKSHGFDLGEVLFSLSRRFKTDSASLMKEIEAKDKEIEELKDALLAVGIDVLNLKRKGLE